MIILLSGKQSSGKTSAASALQACLNARGIQTPRYRFAQPLYEMHDHCIEVLEKYGIRRNIIKDGALLQLIGTEWGRNTIDQNIWVKCAQSWYQQLPAHGDMFGPVIALIDDLRFKNEFTAFEGRDVIKVRIECAREIRRSRSESWRENELHISEIDLDDWSDKFDLVLNSAFMSTDVIVNAIVREINERISERSGAGAGTGLHSRGSETSVAQTVQ
jgi:hypothetical protein